MPLCRAAHCAPRAWQRRAATIEQGNIMDDEDFTQLDDPAFLAERSRVRGEIEALTALYAALTAEFDRRAAGAWKAASR
jgi:hypothetical protein